MAAIVQKVVLVPYSDHFISVQLHPKISKPILKHNT